jgi:pimeloyl-ACP methyl ester carboxylesterase
MQKLITNPSSKMDRVVVLCISGRGGGITGPNGMTHLVTYLRNRLPITFGINPQAIFHRSWNINRDSDPSGVPFTNDLLGELTKRTTNPSYVAIIGHSYGGWAACRLSKATKKKPDFVGLIDPVFGVKNSLKRPIDVPRAILIKNWYQNNGVIIPNPCLHIGVPCRPPVNGISCGYQNIPGAISNDHVRFLKTSRGTIRSINCLSKGRVRLLATHTNMDDDAWIRSLIFNQIRRDLNKLIRKR